RTYQVFRWCDTKDEPRKDEENDTLDHRHRQICTDPSYRPHTHGEWRAEQVPYNARISKGRNRDAHGHHSGGEQHDNQLTGNEEVKGVAVARFFQRFGPYL